MAPPGRERRGRGSSGRRPRRPPAWMPWIETTMSSSRATRGARYGAHLRVKRTRHRRGPCKRLTHREASDARADRDGRCRQCQIGAQRDRLASRPRRDGIPGLEERASIRADGIGQTPRNGSGGSTSQWWAQARQRSVTIGSRSGRGAATASGVPTPQRGQCGVRRRAAAWRRPARHAATTARGASGNAATLATRPRAAVPSGGRSANSIMRLLPLAVACAALVGSMVWRAGNRPLSERGMSR